MFQKKVNIGRDDFCLEIWDTAGQEEYHALGPMFYRGSDGGIVVFDVADSTSFSRARQWVTELKQARGEEITVVVAANKCDLASVRTVNLAAIVDFSRALGVECIETSAKTGEGIEMLFGTLLKRFAGQPKMPAMTSGRAAARSSVKFDAYTATEKKKGCC
jgi:small GTP-binding protein